VLLNNHLVGHLTKEPGGAIAFQYAAEWLARRQPPIPVSLSLPVRETAYKGAPVVAVFENLLPDSDALRQRVAEKVGAQGIDAYSLLAEIGRDCVGALQFLPAGDDKSASADALDTSHISGEVIDDDAIEQLLQNLTQAPLGLERDDPFRISVAGAQEKTALLFHEGRWLKPRGATPTTHLFKKSLGRLTNGLDLSDSVENEHYCLRLLAAFGLPVNASEIRTFGKTKALVIERFDRRRMSDGRLTRLPQEDFCQALSVPPTRKYQSAGGPGMVEILELLKGSDAPAADQKQFLKAQILYWLIAATDGHAKNFSIFLGPGGRFMLTPCYDVLSIQPNLDARHLYKKQAKMTMFVGKSHYRLDYIRGGHFLQTTKRAGLPASIAREALAEIAANVDRAFQIVEAQLLSGPSEAIHASVKNGLYSRLDALHDTEPKKEA
jgi:serine/threonine-protein kinase HipA